MKYLQRPAQMVLIGLVAALASTGCDTLSSLLSDAPPADPAASAIALGQNATCTTPNYVAKIVWQGDQPTMSFGKPAQLTLNNAPAASATNPDGSVTYRADGEASTYARLYPNSTCFVQVVGTENQVVLEENGTVGS